MRDRRGGEGDASEHDGAGVRKDEVAPAGAEASVGDGDTAPEGAEPRWYVTELLLSLELVALAAFAFSRPVLDGFGDSPETFVMRGVGGVWVVVFGVVVTAVPALVAVAVGLGARRLAGRFAPDVQAVLVGVLGGVGVWQFGQEVAGGPGDATKMLVAGSLGGAALLAARRWLPPVPTFLRIAGVSSLVYLLLFLVASPATDLISADLLSDDPALADIAGQLDDDPPDVVVIVFDELPVETLLDGTGHIDGELFPHFADLAGDATWYRNNTTVAGFTPDAVPAILTGRYPVIGDDEPAPDGENLFTLLGGSYDVQAIEQVTSLCPGSLCPETQTVGLGPLLGDAVHYWAHGPEASAARAMFQIADAVEGAHEAGAEADGLDLAPGPRPHLVVQHVMLPHTPWRMTGDGTRYTASNPPTGLHLDGWAGWGVTVGRQRHVLQTQAADRVLGRYLAALREAGTYDDSLVVVTADHGAAFGPAGTPSRSLTEGNYDQIMWTPLLIKTPGQTAGRVDDTDVRSIDVVPTIADVLGIEVPWSVDGVPAGAPAPDRGGATKPYVRTDSDAWSQAGEAVLELDARAGFARVLAADAVAWEGDDAVWRRTAHGGLLGLDLADLDVGAAATGRIAVDDPGLLDDVRLQDPVPIEVAGTTELPEGTVVAFGVNGTVAAVADVEPGGHVDALLTPWLLVDGANDLSAYLVEGPVGAEVLRPVELAGG